MDGFFCKQFPFNGVVDGAHLKDGDAAGAALAVVGCRAVKGGRQGRAHAGVILGERILQHDHGGIGSCQSGTGFIIAARERPVHHLRHTLCGQVTA